jgi:transposase
MKEQTKAEVKRYFLLGLNSTEIGKLTGYSPRTIQDVIRFEKYRLLKTSKPTTSEKDILKMFENGFKLAEIATHHQRSVSWVKLKLAKVRADRSSFAPYTLSSPKHYKLFEYMANEHGLTLLMSDLIAIERICNGKD